MSVYTEKEKKAVAVALALQLGGKRRRYAMLCCAPRCVCDVVQRVRGMHCSTQMEVCTYTMLYTVVEAYMQELRELG